MSYVKIFPRTIVVSRLELGQYAGQLRCNYEQYGRMYRSCDINVLISHSSNAKLNWFIEPTLINHGVAGFKDFIVALNHYLFETLKFDPLTQWPQTNKSQLEYYFEPVYFDMELSKILTKNKENGK